MAMMSRFRAGAAQDRRAATPNPQKWRATAFFSPCPADLHRIEGSFRLGFCGGFGICLRVGYYTRQGTVLAGSPSRDDKKGMTMYATTTGPEPRRTRAGTPGRKEPSVPPRPIKEPDGEPNRPGRPGSPVQDPRPDKPEKQALRRSAWHRRGNRPWNRLTTIVVPALANWRTGPTYTGGWSSSLAESISLEAEAYLVQGRRRR